MASMHFMSTIPGRPTKFVKFDSSPGRAIGQALDAGLWDEKSYEATLKESDGSEEVYEVRMRLAETESNPGPHPMRKVGIITYKRPGDAPLKRA